MMPHELGRKCMCFNIMLYVYIHKDYFIHTKLTESYEWFSVIFCLHVCSWKVTYGHGKK